MGHERPVISPRNIYLLGGVLVALLVIGSVFDDSISQALFNEASGFGLFLAAYGDAPALLAWVMSGTLFIVARSNSRSPLQILQLLIGAGLIAMGTGALVIVPLGHWGLPLVVHIVVAVVLAGGTCALSVRLARGVTRYHLVQVAIVLSVVVVVEMIVVTAVKLLWERPRMRMLAQTDGATFTPWWSPGYPGRSELLDGGVDSSEFKSFPSGHTSNAATLIVLLTAVAMVKEDLKRYAGMLWWIGAAWALIVAYSRIIIGAHFLTDTVVGIAITFVIIVGTYQFVFNPPQQLARHANP